MTTASDSHAAENHTADSHTAETDLGTAEAGAVTAAPPGSSAAAGVIRVSEFIARSGKSEALVEATRGNAQSARRQPGCISAEVCTSPHDSNRVVVISRWESTAALEEFLSWHQGIAHDSVATSVTEKPQSVHYPVVPAAIPA